MAITPSLRHCSNKYKLAREGEKDEDFEKKFFFFFMYSSRVERDLSKLINLWLGCSAVADKHRFKSGLWHFCLKTVWKMYFFCLLIFILNQNIACSTVLHFNMLVLYIPATLAVVQSQLCQTCYAENENIQVHLVRRKRKKEKKKNEVDREGRWPCL